MAPPRSALKAPSDCPNLQSAKPSASLQNSFVSGLLFLLPPRLYQTALTTHALPDRISHCIDLLTDSSRTHLYIYASSIVPLSPSLLPFGSLLKAERSASNARFSIRRIRHLPHQIYAAVLHVSGPPSTSLRCWPGPPRLIFSTTRIRTLASTDWMMDFRTMVDL